MKNERPWILMGFTSAEYEAWCKLHNLKSYARINKTKFFKAINDYVLVKRNNKIYENGEEIKL